METNKLLYWSCGIVFAVSVLYLSACNVMRVHTATPDAPVRVASVQAVWAEPELRDSTEGAIEWWNDELGRVALRLVDDADLADISVLTAPARAGGQPASADPRRGLVFVHAPVDTYRTIRHELGHAAFWLDHDGQQPDSVMAPTLAVDYGQNKAQFTFGDPAPLRPRRERALALMPEDKAAIECMLGLRRSIPSVGGAVACRL